jgi:hypothetical protein
LKLKLAARDGTHPQKARAQAAVQRSKLVEFLRGSDILILDAQYTDEMPGPHRLGHGPEPGRFARARSRAKKLYLFHHDPTHDDHKIDDMLERARFLVIERVAGWKWKPRAKAPKLVERAGAGSIVIGYPPLAAQPRPS